MTTRLELGKVAMRYARALFECASEKGDADAVLDHLELVSDVYGQANGMAHYLENPGVPQSDKLDFIKAQFAMVNPWVNRTMQMLIENGRAAALPMVTEHYRGLVYRRDNIAQAEVISPVELDDKLVKRVKNTLKDTLGYNQVELETRVDPGLLGGLVIKVNDQIIDGSYVGRLEDLRKQVAQV